jgi:hypothetical protein
MLDHNGGMADPVSVSSLEDTSASPPGEGHALPAFPVAEYSRRLQTREARAAAWEARHIRLGYVRLLLVAVLLVVAWFSLYERQWPRWIPALPVAFFAVVMVYHARVLRGRELALRAAEVYRRGTARIEDRWAGMNSRDVPGNLSTHLYAADLDIVGRDGLFELLCTARTRMGEETLLRWLLEPATEEEVLARQQAVAELRGRLDFRERMAVAGDEVVVGVRAEALLVWAEAPDVLRQRWWPWLAGLLAAMAVASVVVWFARGTVVPLFLVLMIEAAARLPLKREIAAVLDGTDVALENMQLLAALLERVEGENFDSERLSGIKSRLSSHAVAGSAAIAWLATLGEFRGSLENPIVRVLNLPLLYSVQLAFAIQRWRRRHGAAVRLWLQALGEMEALLSLAAYSYEHPADPFPEFVDGGGKLEGEELGHPLIAADKCVRNSVRIGREMLGGETRVLLVSGSNMSGKSTLMRTVGVNTVLAMCGAPVRARSLRLTPMRIGASLLVNDSLQSGQSRFYAEIEKLSRICRLAESYAGGGSEAGCGVLFLLDELLQGTNSKDRLVGAQGVIGELVRAGAIGIATTHDLSLTEMVGLESGALKNMHFQDEIVDGQMRFDFRLREGVVARSNGVELMRLIGLKV